MPGAWEELPEGARALTCVEVADAADELPLRTRTDLRLSWLHREGRAPGSSRRLETALAATPFPPGGGFTRVAGEAEVVRRLRQQLLERDLPPEHLRASACWSRQTFCPTSAARRRVSAHRAGTASKCRWARQASAAVKS